MRPKVSVIIINSNDRCQKDFSIVSASVLQFLQFRGGGAKPAENAGELFIKREAALKLHPASLF